MKELFLVVVAFCFLGLAAYDTLYCRDSLKSQGLKIDCLENGHDWEFVGRCAAWEFKCSRCGKTHDEYGRPRGEFWDTWRHDTGYDLVEDARRREATIDYIEVNEVAWLTRDELNRPVIEWKGEKFTPCTVASWTADPNLIIDTLEIKQPTSLSFCNDGFNEFLCISWDSGEIDVSFDPNTPMTETARKFFECLRDSGYIPAEVMSGE